MVLLIGVVTVGIAIVLLAGSAVVEDLNTDSNEEISEETMLKVDSVFQQADEEGQTFEISDEVDKDVSINRNATYNLTLNDNGVCSTGPRQMGTIRHDGAETVTAYEAGGVWKMTEAGAVMSAPPDLNYNNGSLSVSFTNVTGNITSSGTLKATSNVTQELDEQREITGKLYSDPACSPTAVDNASLKISNSTFARAWASWARDNYDDRRVSVSVDGGAPAGPYDNVTIKFELGDVSDPDFRAENVTVTPGPGSNYEVTAEVTNVGGLSGTDEVTFDYHNGTATTDTDVTLNGKQTKTVTFTLDSSDIVPGSPHNVTVAADTNSTAKVQFNSPTATPNAQFSAENISSGTTVGNASNGHVWVENTGGMTKTATLRLEVTGQPDTTWNATIHPGENVSTDVSDALPIDRPGMHQLKFSVGSDSMQRPFVVGPPGRFDITNVVYDTPTRGETKVFSATVQNAGNQTMTGSVNATIKNEDTDTVVATTNATETLSDSSTVTRTVSHTFPSTGSYSLTVTTPNQTQRSTFYVKAGNAAPNFVIQRLELDPSSVRRTNDVAINVTVTNSGGTTDEQTIDLDNERTNTDLEAWDVTLSPGQTTTERFVTTVENDSSRFELGQNTIEVETDNGSLGQILEVREQGSGVEENQDSDGSEFLEFTKNARIKIVAGGAELEGLTRGPNGNLWEFSAPTTVRTYVENDTMSEVTPLWTSEYNGNINHPHAEQRMYQPDIPNPYVERMTVSAGSELSIWGTSYNCNDYDYSDDNGNYYTHDRNGYRLGGQVCDDRGRERIEITDTKSSSNVVILGNGDPAPAPGQADWYQLELNQMLDTVNASLDGDGNLQLAEDQYIFMYELSKENASAENAAGPNDPDYNDAVVSLKVVSTERENVQPATFNITDVDAPALVTSPSGAGTNVDVTIENTGEKAGQATVYPAFAGASQSPVSTSVLQPGEETDVTLTLPTTSYTPGTYNWEVEVAGTDGTVDDAQTQQLRIGSTSGPYYQVTKLEGPAAAEINAGSDDTDDSNPVIRARVDNTGSEDGTDMDVTLVYENTDTGTSYTVTETHTIPSGNNKELDFEITATPGREGTYNYYVVTPNTTSANQSIEIGHSRVTPTNINIGTKNYTPGTQIIRRGRISRLNVGVENVGVVSDEREVRLRITDGGGGTVVDDSKTDTVYTSATQPTQYGFDVSALSTGNTYDYEILVYNDTQSAQSGPTVTSSGELFLQKVPDGVSTREDSPVNVDSDLVNVTAT
ncbi:hypothetical protein [Haloarcula pelagica]|uniref:hypothetical protein n=1 Tax=Haloarcula pelagica TaxID=3033389 RepID=UPI0024C33A00|nr:hypothetical protein [Halomicroarcula sp. YJ-61-S]